MPYNVKVKMDNGISYEYVYTLKQIMKFFNKCKKTPHLQHIKTRPIIILLMEMVFDSMSEELNHSKIVEVKFKGVVLT